MRICATCATYANCAFLPRFHAADDAVFQTAWAEAVHVGAKERERHCLVL